MASNRLSSPGVFDSPVLIGVEVGEASVGQEGISLELNHWVTFPTIFYIAATTPSISTSVTVTITMIMMTMMMTLTPTDALGFKLCCFT